MNARTGYAVVCMACGQVFNPGEGSSLWWQAKKHAEAGRLNALHISGEKCGCVKIRHEPEAPFRVFGYDDLCSDFNIPYKRFTDAVRQFIELDRNGGYVVFIEGVSPAVKTRLSNL